MRRLKKFLQTNSGITFVCIYLLFNRFDYSISHISTFFIKNIWEHQFFLCFHCFGLLVTSALGFKTRVVSLLACFVTCNGFFRFTSGVVPADLLEASMIAEPFRFRYLHMYKNWCGCELGPLTQSTCVFGNLKAQ